MCLEFRYREPWWGIVGCWAGGAGTAWVGVYRLAGGFEYAPPLARTISACVLIGLAVLIGGLALVATVDRLRGGRIIKVTRTAITAPRSRWSGSSVTIRFDEITALDGWESRDRGRLRIEWGGGRLTLLSLLLPHRKDFERLLRVLQHRLEPLEVPVNVRRASSEARPFRPQFSLAWLLVVVTFVAVMLGLHGYVYGKYSWDALYHVGYATAIAVGFWLAWAGRWPARVFILGFLAGFWIEILAVCRWLALDWVRYSGASATPENWYPLTFALRQLAERTPQAVWILEGPRAVLAGSVISGLVCGMAAVIGWCMWKHARRRAEAKAAKRGSARGPD